MEEGRRVVQWGAGSGANLGNDIPGMGLAAIKIFEIASNEIKRVGPDGPTLIGN